MKNLIYAGTNTSTSVNVGGTIPINTIVKRFNRCNASSEINAVGNSVIIETEKCCRPRYNGIASITFAGATAGNGIISVYQDGVEIPLANATATITTPTTQYVTVAIPFSVQAKGCTTTALTMVNTGAIGITVINANILVFED